MNCDIYLVNALSDQIFFVDFCCCVQFIQFLHGDFECLPRLLFDVGSKSPSVPENVPRGHELSLGGQDRGVLLAELCWGISPLANFCHLAI